MSKEPNFTGVSKLPPDQADIRRQQEVQKSIKAAVPEWLQSGRLVNGELTDATEKSVTHGLKRVPRGWFMGNMRGDVDVVNVVQTAADANVLTLKNNAATGTLSFTLWVY